MYDDDDDTKMVTKTREETKMDDEKTNDEQSTTMISQRSTTLNFKPKVTLNVTILIPFDSILDIRERCCSLAFLLRYSNERMNDRLPNSCHLGTSW
jgi:hypothetical protein